MTFRPAIVAIFVPKNVQVKNVDTILFGSSFMSSAHAVSKADLTTMLVRDAEPKSTSRGSRFVLSRGFLRRSEQVCVTYVRNVESALMATKIEKARKYSCLLTHGATRHSFLAKENRLRVASYMFDLSLRSNGQPHPAVN